MNKPLVICISVILALSFAIILIVSPDDEEFLARYSDENYVTAATFDVPADARIVKIVSSTRPFDCRKVTTDTDRLEIKINREIFGDFTDHMLRNMKAELHASGTTLNLEISLPGDMWHYTVGTFTIARLFDYYDRLMDEQAEIMICAPENYVFE
jgi:hypothetical protein